jgi:hypothetical protein
MSERDEREMIEKNMGLSIEFSKYISSEAVEGF